MVQYILNGMSHIVLCDIVMNVLFLLDLRQFLWKMMHQEYITTTCKYLAPILDSNKSNIGLIRTLQIENIKNTIIKPKKH